MQRRLILLRHAKSDWGHEGQTDHARPLNARGRAAAPQVAQRLRELGWSPALALVSDAARAQETWALMRPALGEVSHQRAPALYLAEPPQLRASIGAAPDEVATLMVVGHNPGLEDLSASLAGYPVTLTTCNAACFEAEGQTWGEALKGGSWRLVHLLRPKELG